MIQTFETLDQDAIDYMKEYAYEANYLVVEILSDTHFELYNSTCKLGSRITIQEDSFKDAYKRFINFCDDYELGSIEISDEIREKLDSYEMEIFKLKKQKKHFKELLKETQKELEITRGALDGFNSNNKRRM